ncbi:MAG: hypothetical protein OXU24_14520 [Gammaproteobacteria bacterium]|nr:hypothetical protein [Gammaproteobacteria bacterium]
MRRTVAISLFSFLAICALNVNAQSPFISGPLIEAPLRPQGQNVIPLFDGWFPNEDGSFTLCFGYYNLNTQEIIDVPLGEKNFITPAVYDGGQPTHFDVPPDPELTREFRRYWCVFSVIVPADFGMQDVTWNIETQGQMLSVPGTLIPSYVLDEAATSGRETSAPYLSLNDNPPNFRGRRGLFEGPRQARVGEPANLIARLRHSDPGTWINWTLHQGPDAVEFATPEARLDTAEGVFETTVTFTEPGTYVLRIQVINDTERQREPTYGFEFYCCWTNGYLTFEVTE